MWRLWPGYADVITLAESSVVSYLHVFLYMIYSFNALENHVVRTLLVHIYLACSEVRLLAAAIYISWKDF